MSDECTNPLCTNPIETDSGDLLSSVPAAKRLQMLEGLQPEATGNQQRINGDNRCEINGISNGKPMDQALCV
jgi:hypothetical protein